MALNVLLLIVVAGFGMSVGQKEGEEPTDSSPAFPKQSVLECRDYLLDLNGGLKTTISNDELTLSCIRSRLWYESSQSTQQPAEYMPPDKYKWFERQCHCRDVDSCLMASANHTGRPFYRYRYRWTRQAGGGRSIRKEIRMMTDDERRAYFDAVNEMKMDFSSGQSLYDFFVSFHVPNRSPAAHFGASFLPWHREYLKQYGIAIRTYAPSAGLPYWDSTLDSYLPNPADSILFSSIFFGNGNGRVITGPFAGWTTSAGLSLTRNLGQAGLLFTPSMVNTVLSQPDFSQLTFCVNPYYETAHGGVHTWVGGQMGSIIVSPNDPIFFSYHAYIDYIWELFRQLRQTPRQRETDYPPASQSCSQAHSANARMLPFTIRNIDGLSNSYVNEFFVYEPSPTCTATTDCGSDYLFCDRRSGRPHCVSKVIPGGSCAGFANTDICYKSRCIQGRCV